MVGCNRWLALGLIVALAPVAAQAADRHETVAGWTLDDVGGKPGDDSDRAVTMHKAIPAVTLGYSPGEGNGGGSIQMKFNRCRGLSYGSGFTFDDPPASHAAQVRKQVEEAFADFAESCPGKTQDEAVLMQGFDQAFATIEAWVKDHPFTYPPDTNDKPDAAAPATTPDAPSTPDVPMI